MNRFSKFLIFLMGVSISINYVIGSAITSYHRMPKPNFKLMQLALKGEGCSKYEIFHGRYAFSEEEASGRVQIINCVQCTEYILATCPSKTGNGNVLKIFFDIIDGKPEFLPFELEKSGSILRIPLNSHQFDPPIDTNASEFVGLESCSDVSTLSCKHIATTNRMYGENNRISFTKYEPHKVYFQMGLSFGRNKFFLLRMVVSLDTSGLFIGSAIKETVNLDHVPDLSPKY